MGTYKGPFSGDGKEENVNAGVGLDRNAYNPGSKPNVYVSNAKGTNKIKLDILDHEDIRWAKGEKPGADREDGFSSVTSRSKNHPKY